MKSLLLAAVLMSVAMNSSFAKSGAKGNQTSSDDIRIIRELK